MKNILSRAVGIKNSIVSTISSKTRQITDAVRKKVAILSAAVVLGTSANAMASDWHKADVSGMGPQAFAEQHFGTKEWQSLVDTSGKSIKNPNTDFILGREYTIKDKGVPVVLERKVEPSKKVTKKAPVTKNKSASTVKKPTKKSSVSTKAKKVPKSTTGSKKVSTSPKNAKEEPSKFTNITYNEMLSLPGFDIHFPTYYKSIEQRESAGNQFARNDARGRKLNINPTKFAYGSKQFTVGTLQKYGVNLMERGVIIEERVQGFLMNKRLQDTLMEQYTADSLLRVNKNPKLIEHIVHGKVSLVSLLAKGHIAGHGSINRNPKKGEDWLGTSVKQYAECVEQSYRDTLKTKLAQRENTPHIATATTTGYGISLHAANDANLSSSGKSNVISLVSNVKSSTLRAQIEKKLSMYDSEKVALEETKEHAISSLQALETRANVLERDARSIIGDDSLNKRRFLRDAKNLREGKEAKGLRNQIQKINTLLSILEEPTKKAA